MGSQTAFQVSPDSLTALEGLSAQTRVRLSTYLREAVHDTLTTYEKEPCPKDWRQKGQEGWPTISFHLTPNERRRLARLARYSGVCQRDIIQKSLELLLQKYVEVKPLPLLPPVDEAELDAGRLVSVVGRLNPEALAALRILSNNTRVRQGTYWREAVKDLVRKYERPLTSAPPPAVWTQGMRQTHFLLPRGLRNRLTALCRLTRVEQALLLREALDDLLTKHAVHWRGVECPPDAELAPVACPSPGCGGTAWAAGVHAPSSLLWLRCVACSAILPPAQAPRGLLPAPTSSTESPSC